MNLAITGIGQLVTNDPSHDSGLLGVIADGALVIRDGTVAWVGRETDLPDQYRDTEVFDANGRAVVPGFVDAHTHAVFAGDRSSEFSMRQRGESYEAIQAAGGGIYATVEATRNASLEDLVGTSRDRVQRMVAAGTTTVEIKTGYGLDVATEIKILDAIERIDEHLPVDIVRTFLGAHVVAPEYRDDRSGYIDLVTGTMLDAVAERVEYVDVFCDDAGFTISETRRVTAAARSKGIPVRLHADQLSRTGGTQLAADVGATAADHLDYATDDDLAALRRAGTVAVLLPGVSYSLGVAYPDARRMWDAGVTIALATDCNPGTSYIETMSFIISLAVVHTGLTTAEGVWAATRGGALALGLTDRGILARDRVGDCVVVDAPSYEHLSYRPDTDLVAAVVKRGRLVRS